MRTPTERMPHISESNRYNESEHAVPLPLGAVIELDQRDDRNQKYVVCEVPLPVGDVYELYTRLAEQEGWLVEAHMVGTTYWVLTMSMPGRRVVAEAHRMPGRAQRTRLTLITFLIEHSPLLADEE